MSLDAQGLSATRGGRPILNEVCLRLAPGQIAAVLGENGAGKSTLLDILCGLRPPTRGTVHLGGEDLLALDVAARARRLASLGQRPPELPELTVAERIAQGLFPVRETARDPAARIAAVAAELDLTALVDKSLSTLSGGQQKRTHLARALVHDRAALVVLDEPFAFLDPGQRARVAEALRRRANQGAIVVFAGHHIDNALACADVVLGLKNGVVALGPAPPTDVDEAALLGLFAPPGLRR